MPDDTFPRIHIGDLRWRDTQVGWHTDALGTTRLSTGHVCYSAGQAYGLLAVVPMCRTDEVADGVPLLEPRDEMPLLPATMHAVVHRPTDVAFALAMTGSGARRFCERAMAELGGKWHRPREARAEIEAVIDSGKRDGLLWDGEA